MKILSKKYFKLWNLFLFVAVLLLLSFGLHAFIPHEHPKEIFGQDPINAYLHGEDRKKLLAILLASALFALAVSLKPRITQRETVSQISSFGPLYLSIDLSPLFDPLRVAFRRGILHPKIYE